LHQGCSTAITEEEEEEKKEEEEEEEEAITEAVVDITIHACNTRGL